MDELRASLHRAIQDYGFSGFAFIDAGRPELDVPYYTGTYPPAWERAYIQNDFVHCDPALARVRRTNTPFHWGDLKLPEKTGRKRPPELKMMDAAREHGFKEGFVVPFHYRDRLGAIHSSSTVFFWEDEPRWFHKLFSLPPARIASVDDLLGAARDGHRQPRPAQRAEHPAARRCRPRSSSRAREKEVMAWAARGKTVADTAQILGISPETVEGFIKQALRKLDATNKTHGVAKSIALGLIDL